MLKLMDPEKKLNQTNNSLDGFRPPQTINPQPAPGSNVINPSLPETQPQPPSPPIPNKKRRLSKKFWLILALVLVIGGVAAYIINQQSNDSSKQYLTQQATKKDIPLLRIGYTTGPINSFYPHNKPTEASNFIGLQIFEGLVRYEDQTKIVPELATSWSNPDSSTWIFNLRQGVKFHTGHTLSAKDVKYSLETVKKENSDLDLFHQTIKSVEVIDNNKVEITTDGPDPILLNKLTFLHIIDSQSTKKDDPINGTGPYTLKPGTSPSENNLDLVAFDKYHGGHIYTRELQFTWEKDEAQAINSFNSGKYDIAGNLLSSENISKAKINQRYTAEQPGLNFIMMNTTKTGPLQKLQVRQALQHILDPATIAKVKGDGSKPSSQVIPQDIPGHNPELKRPEHNVTKAEELLAAAGYPKGLTLNFLSSSQPSALVNELVRQFAEGGVTLKTQNIDDFDQFFDQAFGGGPNIDLVNLGFNSDVLDGTDFLNIFVNDNKNYSLPEINKLIEEVNQTSDPQTRLKKLEQAAKLLHDQASVIPITDTRSLFVLNKPYRITQDTFQSLGVYFYKVYLK